jgi:hypothetical protein
MLIFIDESGIQKKDGLSSVALVYVMVNDIERLNQAVCVQESILNIPVFHWSKYNWKIRRAFFLSLLKEAFTVKAILVQNPFSEDIFESAVRQLLTERKVQNIIIDGKKPIRYVLRLKKVLREHHVSVSKIRMGNDLAFPGLRVADAFAGLVRSASEKDNIKARELYEIVKIKITTLSGGPVSG